MRMMAKDLVYSITGAQVFPPTSGQIALILKYGSVAQMAERALSMREARGSMPLSSNSIIHICIGECSSNGRARASHADVV